MIIETIMSLFMTCVAPATPTTTPAPAIVDSISPVLLPDWADRAKLDRARDVSYLTKFEKDLILEVNLVRSNPKAYAKEYLEPMIGKCKHTSELKECINEMKQCNPMTLLNNARGLYLFARQHSQYLAKKSRTGHTRSNGKSFGDAVDKYGNYNSVAENISYGNMTARDVIIDLLIDDGVESRGHRRNILSPDKSHIGMSTSYGHKEYNQVVVMDFALNWTDK